MVLTVLSSLVALTVGLAYRTRIELKLTRATAERTRAFYLARGGIERIKLLLGQGELSPQVIAAICPFASTASQEELFQPIKSFQVDRMQLAYRMYDEQGHLHVNKSNPVGWENIGGLDREFTASVLDWTDSDDKPNLDGAESDFYARLAPPYAAKNRPCISIRELLLVRGVDHSRYLGKAMTWDAAEDDSEDGQEREADRSYSGLVNVFTVYGDGAININTAERDILASLPGLDEQAIEAIFAHRNGPDGLPRTEDDRPITSAEDLSQVEGLFELQADLLAQYCCWQSQFFRVFSRASVGNGSVCYLMASIDVADGTPKVLCVERLL